MREETMKLQKEREEIEKEKAKLMALTHSMKSGRHVEKEKTKLMALTHC
jgi:cell shape-determining protein MreC